MIADLGNDRRASALLANDHVVADLAVVPDMRADHEEAVVADLGHAAAASSVPIFMVTLSRMSQSAPIARRVGSPWYCTDCGGVPSDANGWIDVPRRCVVWPATCTWR